MVVVPAGPGSTSVAEDSEDFLDQFRPGSRYGLNMTLN
jgi:hypothetical protein